MRDGEVVGKLAREEASVEKMARLMVGRKIDRIQKTEKKSNGSIDENILEIKNLKVNMPGERVKDVSLEVKKGEILGIGGLAGHGKIGIANGVMGLYPSSGEVVFNGDKIKLNNPKDALSKGMAFVSEDRRGVGLLEESMKKHCLTAMQVGQILKKLQVLICSYLENKGPCKENHKGLNIR